MPKCVKCSATISKRQVLCSKDWSDLAKVRQDAVKTVYGRGPDQLKLIDMLINGDLKNVQKIVSDKDARIQTFKQAKAVVHIADKPAEEVQVIYKKVKV